MATSIQVFSDLQASDLLFLGEAALKTLEIALVAISIGTIFGTIFGWLLNAGNLAVRMVVNGFLDVFPVLRGHLIHCDGVLAP